MGDGCVTHLARYDQDLWLHVHAGANLFQVNEMETNHMVRSPYEADMISDFHESTGHVSLVCDGIKRLSRPPPRRGVERRKVRTNEDKERCEFRNTK